MLKHFRHKLSLTLTILLVGCSPLRQYCHENNVIYRKPFEATTTLGKRNEKHLISAPIFSQHGQPDISSRTFQRKFKGGLTLPFPFFTLSLAPQYEIAIDKGYLRSAKVIYPKGFFDLQATESVIVSELGTGEYASKLGGKAIFNGWIEGDVSSDTPKNSDRIVGVRTVDFQASTKRTLSLARGTDVSLSDLLSRLKFDSVYLDSSDELIANVHIIAGSHGVMPSRPWNPSPEKVQKLRANGEHEKVATGLVWHGPSGLCEVADYEQRLPMKRAQQHGDTAIVKVAENDYLLLEVTDITSDGSQITVVVQKIAEKRK